jgi:hypothetical protein
MVPSYYKASVNPVMVFSGPKFQKGASEEPRMVWIKTRLRAAPKLTPVDLD